MLTQEQKEKNFSTFKRYLIKLFGETPSLVLINKLLGGEEVISEASFGMSKDSGCAYEGSFLENVLGIANIAVNINDTIMPEEKRVEVRQLYRVILLQHLSKILMYEKNTNQWEIENRGILYKFRNTNVILRGGERVIHLLLQAGINDITEEEYEAIRIIDKVKEDDFSVSKYTSILACIVKQANEINSIINAH